MFLFILAVLSTLASLAAKFFLIQAITLLILSAIIYIAYKKIMKRREKIPGK